MSGNEDTWGTEVADGRGPSSSTGPNATAAQGTDQERNVRRIVHYKTATMNTNVFWAGQVPSIRSPQRGGEDRRAEELSRTFRGTLNKLNTPPQPSGPDGQALPP
ncbi:hypothetical protein D4764_18G0003410 [Takifugu flavidus]|uniref:Uncharacterized protein n=1 Tax=Takifugu flavidus TaxID=433684 RepID=A0A5C6NRH8_9TELE|nr:hypothetical protein D4764_18G0003410 [Takifugu flavidus]